MRESVGSTKPKGATKVKVGWLKTEVGSRASSRGRTTSPSGCFFRHGGPGGSESVHVGTRKMVNYA